MPLATADQFSLYGRRYVGAVLIEMAAIFLAPVAAVLAFVLLGEQGIYPKVAAAVSLPVGRLLPGPGRATRLFSLPRMRRCTASRIQARKTQRVLEWSLQPMRNSVRAYIGFREVKLRFASK